MVMRIDKSTCLQYSSLALLLTGIGFSILHPSSKHLTTGSEQPSDNHMHNLYVAAADGNTDPKSNEEQQPLASHLDDGATEQSPSSGQATDEGSPSSEYRDLLASPPAPPPASSHSSAASNESGRCGSMPIPSRGQAAGDEVVLGRAASLPPTNTACKTSAAESMIAGWLATEAAADC